MNELTWLTNPNPSHSIRSERPSRQITKVLEPASLFRLPCDDFPTVRFYMAGLACERVTVTDLAFSVGQWQEIGGSLERAFESQVSLVGQLYRPLNSPSIFRYLAANRLVAQLLIEAAARIAEYFPGCPASLRLIEDHDEDNDKLVVHIHTRATPDEALAQLERFDYDWWLGASSRAHGRLLINMQYDD
jgi:hypothetical protein